MRPRVYVAGPYSCGSVTENVGKAIDVGHRLLNAGYAPLVPHLTHFMDLVFTRCYEEWMEMDLAWVAAANAVLRLPGRSEGADREVALALSLGIPVFYSVAELCAGWPVMLGENG